MPAKRTKPIAFPIAVKAGSSTVRIYRDRKPSGEYFRVVYHLGGKRHRLNFRDLDSAKTEAAAKAAQLARGDMDAAQITGKDRLIYGRATLLPGALARLRSANKRGNHNNRSAPRSIAGGRRHRCPTRAALLR